ncbi:host-nuclease inhibitor Gam family protein [Accumulibacter sp.]|uniref:host-nuclease inhibitor Gam family protein n=1 Tax=Accumulibacter sp. TaxID=2053492 RepID=UPI0025C61332|nr:host-nuclease inhibitor Gam family protein [Accumulibacter sp.]
MMITINGSKKRLKSPATPNVPQTLEEVADLISGIGIDSRELTLMECEMNETISRIKEAYEQRADPIRLRIADAQRGVQGYCDAHRAVLTDHGKIKTYKFTSGEVCWRTRPPSVRITGQDAVLFSLQQMGLNRFVRLRIEINREAILNEPEAVARVPGIFISQIEDFVVTPFELELNGTSP